MTFTSRRPTHVSVVFDALIRADDFRTARILVAETRLTAGQVSASLHNLYKYHAADFIEAPDGLWWYATQDTDTRIRTVDERRPEKGRKRRSGYKRSNRGFHRD